MLLQAAKQREQHLQQAAMDLQMELMGMRESSAQGEQKLRRQLESLREELQLSAQNAEITREALQVTYTWLQNQASRPLKHKVMHHLLACSTMPEVARSLTSGDTCLQGVLNGQAMHSV